MQFVEFENRDGARFSWNVLPTTRLDALRMAVPIGCLYSPLKPINGLGTVRYRPILCANSSCGAILNPYWYHIPSDFCSGVVFACFSCFPHTHRTHNRTSSYF